MNPLRSAETDNPLTFYERYVISREALLEDGRNFREFSLVPLPFNFPELYRSSIPLKATFSPTICE